ncbi:hypothetical protein KI659_00035 [Litoribacter alkaliphilus]|uniref:Uncharacterized protein n=1 Tax=Litoribacter ruber TaxID=702568 RepID=A0AAP2CEN4_9BACT|nr:hypothetical protein [Litoribacter alkaliphilus]MBS9522392.1 hypothetical protein [Litoribacter alkaliphilus]
MPKKHEFPKWKIDLFREKVATLNDVRDCQRFYNQVFKITLQNKVPLEKNHISQFEAFFNSIRRGNQDQGFHKLYFVPASFQKRNILLDIGESLLYVKSLKLPSSIHPLYKIDEIIFFQAILERISDRIFKLGLLHKKYFN